MFAQGKKSTNKCIDCGKDLQLFELDTQKELKIMKCEDCGLFHIYTKALLGGWKIKKATKDPSHVPSI